MKLKCYILLFSLILAITMTSFVYAQSSGSGEGGGPTGVVKSIPGSGSGGGPMGTNENPIICDGCVLGDKCVFVGYRSNDKYCELSGEFDEQKEADSSCENNFECSSNLCMDDQCISSSL